MWKLRLTIGLAVTSALMLLLPVVVYAALGWKWNAAIDLEGVEVRTEWTVDGGVSVDAADDYSAKIRVAVPKGAEASIEEIADNENVVIERDDGLECKDDGIEAEFFYRVTRVGSVVGDPVVRATVTADGQYVSSATGHLDETIKLQLLIPADHPDC